MISDWLLGVAAAPALVSTGHLALLTAASARTREPAREKPRTRFVFLIPAHDEETGIARTVKSLKSVDYPRSLFRVVVVADNCIDRTAERARAAGAEVWLRNDTQQRGKGYALSFGFERIVEEPFADAVVVIDADSEAEPGFLRAMDQVVRRGALAAQSASGVLNPNASWRTQLMTLALTLFNDVRSLGRERLGLSCGLRGNGMCLTRALLERHPHRAFSRTEDLEYGIALGRAGVRVHFAEHAWVRSMMTRDEKAAATQRRRWEGGRVELARSLRGPLLREAVKRKDPMLGELALDLFVPPLAKVGALVGAGLLAGAAVSAAHRHVSPGLVPWALSAAFLTAHVARGWQLSGLGMKALSALAHAPGYVFWKLRLKAQKPPAHETGWVRTAREEAA